MSLTLYYHPLASFCHKVLIALYESGSAFERRIINLADAADRADLEALWPMRKFPVLHDATRARTVAESSIIIEYLDRFYAAERCMIPDEWEAALDVRYWDRLCDNYLQVPMQHIVAARLRGDTGNTVPERAMLDRSYAMLEQRLTSRLWLAGADFSLADCAAAPALFYAFTVHPWPADLAALNQYFVRLAARPSVQRVLEEAKPYFGLFPFADAIPARFR